MLSEIFCTYTGRYIRRRQWQATPVLLPGKSHGHRSLVGCSPWGRYELDMTERLHFHFSISRIGEGNGNPLQCSCLENPRDRGSWWAAVYGVAQSRTRLKRLSSSSRQVYVQVGFPGGSVVKNSSANAGDTGSIPGWGRSPEEGNGNPLQYSCLGNPMDRDAWWATVHGVAKSWTPLSNLTTCRGSSILHRSFSVIHCSVPCVIFKLICLEITLFLFSLFSFLFNSS